VTGQAVLWPRILRHAGLAGKLRMRGIWDNQPSCAVPMHAVVFREEIYQAVIDATPRTTVEFFHDHTYSGHPRLRRRPRDPTLSGEILVTDGARRR
jgi:hypothetical protein